MGQSIIVLGLLPALVLIGSGCVSPEPPPHELDTPTERDEASSNDDHSAIWLTNSTWSRLTAVDCTSTRLIMPSHPVVFPFPPPEEWPAARPLQAVRFDLHVYSCSELLLGTDHVFHNASFAWESHTNLSWKETPDFNSNSLDGLLAVYVDNETLAGLLEDAGLSVIRARIDIAGGLQSPVATIENDHMLISLALEGIDYVPSESASTLHVVPAGSSGDWLRIDVKSRLEHTYGLWELQVEGESATATMAESPTGWIRTNQAYAATGSFEITWERGFA